MLKFSMNEVTSQHWSFEQDIRFYQQLDIPAISVQRSKMEAFGLKRAASLLKESGMTVASLLWPIYYALDDRSRWPAQIEDARKTLDIAASVEAESLVVTTGPCGSLLPDEAEERFLEIAGEVLPHAERLGIVLALEPASPLRIDRSFIHTHHDMLDLIDRVDSPHLKLCLEMNDAWVERRLYEDIKRRSGRIGIVQIDDFKAGTRCSPQRVPLGDGVIPLQRIIAALHEAGYRGYYDVELTGDDIEAMGYEEAIRRSVGWIRRLPGY
ncbi:MAG: sugar phosphate isomerase/epimerase [Chloroflexi bacterium]|nr:sugar phosphate isomerase/epimerase [Chloroflexota bacterium]